jgi:PAS domain S-box-containing protein
MSRETTVTQHTPEGVLDHIQRCAVCKIDLRGRFVYADTEFESLIGRTQDELFGRLLTEFAPEQDHDSVNRLLIQQSQYESIHESALIRLIDSSGTQRPVAMISSLNFVAGNAVNFLVVFHALEAARPLAAPSAKPISPDSILTSLAGRNNNIVWSDHVTLIRDLADADECLVYRSDGDSLVLAATSADPGGGEQAITLSGPTDDLHWWLAQSGEQYRFDNPDHVRAALEAVSEAPTELILPMNVAEGERLLLRCVYPTDSEQRGAHLAAALDRTQLFVSLLTSTPAVISNPASIYSNAQADTEPTAIADLAMIANLAMIADTLNVGVCELKQDDSLGTINQTLSLQLHGIAVASLKDLLAAVTHESDAISRKMISDAVCTCRSGLEKSTCSVCITGHDEIAGTVTVIRKQESADSPLWLCFQPCRQSSIGASMSRSATLQLLDHLHRLVTTAAESAAPLTHAAFAEASAPRKLQLVTLTDTLQQADQLVGELQHIASLAGRPRKMQEVNLNMLVAQLFERLRREASPIAVNVACGDLPIIRSACAELEAALLAITRIILAGVTGPECHLRVETATTDSGIAIICGIKSGETDSRSLLDRLTGATTGSERLLHDQLALAVALDPLQAQLEAVPGDNLAVRLILPRA